MTVSQAAKALKVKPYQIYRWLARKVLAGKGEKYGVYVDSVEELKKKLKR